MIQLVEAESELVSRFLDSWSKACCSHTLLLGVEDKALPLLTTSSFFFLDFSGLLTWVDRASVWHSVRCMKIIGISSYEFTKTHLTWRRAWHVGGWYDHMWQGTFGWFPDNQVGRQKRETAAKEGRRPKPRARFFLLVTLFVSQVTYLGISVLVCQLGKAPCLSL